MVSTITQQKIAISLGGTGFSRSQPRATVSPDVEERRPARTAVQACDVRRSVRRAVSATAAYAWRTAQRVVELAVGKFGAADDALRAKALEHALHSRKSLLLAEKPAPRDAFRGISGVRIVPKMPDDEASDAGRKLWIIVAHTPVPPFLPTESKPRAMNESPRFRPLAVTAAGRSGCGRTRPEGVTTPARG